MSKNEIEIEGGELPSGNHYHPMSKEELRTTAIDLVSGMAFASWQIKEYDVNLLPVIFLPFAMLSSLQIKEIERDEIVHFIGHMSDSVHHSINGYPCFSSMRVINQADVVRLGKFIDAVSALEEHDDG